MASSPKPCYLLSLALIFFLCFGLILPSVNTSSNYNNLVYKSCVNPTFSDPNGSLSQILSSLFQELVAQSSQSKFFETNVGDDKTAISGLFQCREDLSNDDCYSCVSELPKMSNSLCGETIPTRVQLSGCHIHYEADGSENSGLELLHKTCSESKAVLSGFEELRDASFAALESGVISSNGFCDMSYGSMHVTAQCEGNLETCDCGECVSYAVRIAQNDCGYSLSGEVYLNNCFISYGFDPNGMPGNSNPEKGTGNNSRKRVAIVVGGVAVLSFGLVFFYSIKSSRKKRDDW